MPTTHFGTWGLGVLAPHASTTWVSAPLVPGGAWNFWVDNTTISYTSTFVSVSLVWTERQGNTHRVRVTVHNGGQHTAGFALRWSAVYP